MSVIGVKTNLETLAKHFPVRRELKRENHSLVLRLLAGACLQSTFPFGGN